MRRPEDVCNSWWKEKRSRSYGRGFLNFARPQVMEAGRHRQTGRQAVAII